MATLEMNGPFKLTNEEVEKHITKKSPGNYALGKSSDDTFHISYVGRADVDLKDRLLKWVDKYVDFKFSYATSPKDAFLKECKNYHDFGGKEKLKNQIHPDRPKDTDWKCPICDIFDK
jgi:hypothetical protein